MNKLALVAVFTLFAIATCALNVEDIQSLFQDTASGSHIGRLLMDPAHNRVILTGKNYVQFIDTKTKAIIPITLNQYTALTGEFLDSNGQYYVFGSTPKPQEGFKLISIDGSGKYTEKQLKNLMTFGCVLYMSESTIFMTTKQKGSSVLASYDYKNDNITGATALVEDYSDNDCIRYKDTGFFLTNKHIIAVDMTNTRIIKHIDTKLVENAPGYNRMAVDPKYGKIYITYSLYTDVFQYDINNQKIAVFKGDADQYAGYLGLSTHPSDGSAYFFTTALKRTSTPSTTIVETDYRLGKSNSYNIPNDIFFFRRGHFDLNRKRMYVLGYQTETGHLNVYSVGLDRWFHLSKAAIIGIAVGGGASLLLLLAGIGACMYYSFRRPKVYEEKSRLLGTTYISTA